MRKRKKICFSTEKICLIESFDDLLSLLESPAAAHLWV